MSTELSKKAKWVIEEKMLIKDDELKESSITYDKVKGNIVEAQLLKGGIRKIVTKNNALAEAILSELSSLIRVKG